NVRPIVCVRFAPNVPRADALRIATDAARAADNTNAELRTIARPLAGVVLDPYYRRAMPLLAGGVVLVFLVLAADVGSLPRRSVATLAAGLLPAWLGTSVNMEQSLRVTDRGATETRTARAVMRTLLVGEIALACTLLVGATLLVRSFINLAHAERGLDADGVLMATMSLPASAFPYQSSRTTAARSIEEQIGGLAGVERVAWSYGLPPHAGAVSFGKW